MEKWGIFVNKNEVDYTIEAIKERGLEVFEVRELNFMEKLTYVKDPALFVGEPWIVMFNATKREYKKLCRKLKLTVVF